MLPPLYLGIGILLHQDYGTRKLIDLLNAFGFSASYPEVRQFVTSLAANELDKIKDGVYYPAGIRKLSEGGNLIQEGVDNININTNTILLLGSAFNKLGIVCMPQKISVYPSVRNMHLN